MQARTSQLGKRAASTTNFGKTAPAEFDRAVSRIPAPSRLDAQRTSLHWPRRGLRRNRKFVRQSGRTCGKYASCDLVLSRGGGARSDDPLTMTLAAGWRRSNSNHRHKVSITLTQDIRSLNIQMEEGGCFGADNRHCERSGSRVGREGGLN